MALSDVVIATNETFRHLAVARGRRNPEDVFVVRNGPNPDVFRPVEPDPALRARAEYLIGYVGLMGPQDGVEDAVRALGGVLARRRTDWHAIFVGDGEALGGARSLAAVLGIGDRVTFEGYVSDRRRIVEIIASCDLSLSPEPRNALNESSTLIKVAEAMAVACPVVAFDLRETRATAGDAGTYARGDTSEAFAEAIVELLDSPAERERKGSSAESASSRSCRGLARRRRCSRPTGAPSTSVGEARPPLTLRLPRRAGPAAVEVVVAPHGVPFRFPVRARGRAGAVALDELPSTTIRRADRGRGEVRGRARGGRIAHGFVAMITVVTPDRLPDGS